LLVFIKARSQYFRSLAHSLTSGWASRVVTRLDAEGSNAREQAPVHVAPHLILHMTEIAHALTRQNQPVHHVAPDVVGLHPPVARGKRLAGVQELLLQDFGVILVDNHTDDAKVGEEGIVALRRAKNVRS